MDARKYVTQMEEALCAKYIELGSQVDAYRAVYDVESRTRDQCHALASKAFGRPLVAARIAELRDQVAAEAIVSRAWVVARLVELHATAMATETLNLAAANKALELMGIELGMFVKRRLIGRLEHMTEEEILEFLGGEPSGDELKRAADTLSALARARPAGNA
jgi:hypothetical protein